MADCLNTSEQLNLVHVPFLLQHLSRYAYKWKEIGTALKFQPQDLRNIEACQSLIATGPASFMQRLVEEWLERKHQHAAHPTLANLTKALKIYPVLLGTLATQIKNSFDESGNITIKVFNIAFNQHNTRLDQGEDNIKIVNESTHVHFEVKVDPKTKTCQWTNESDNPYADIDKPLCIPEADIDMDGGRYYCKISKKNANQGDKQLVTLRVNCPELDQFKKSLASIYLTQPEVPQDTWPPVSNKVYINLALVKQQEIDYNEKYARRTIQGDMDDVLHHKEKLEYKDLFDGVRSGSRLLIEGRPGSGKTTFIHKITRDWAASETPGPMRLVLLVSLRVLNSWKKPATLDDILDMFDLQKSETILRKRQGKGVCFIFDGLDEFSPIDGDDSFVYKIIKKETLRQSIVIVASRPAALVKLRPLQKPDKVVEVIGFPSDQIFEYVKNYPFSDTSKADKLKSYLSSHPNVLHMCYLPIHVAMIAFIFKVEEEVPCTETEIYKHFTRFTVMRSLSKHKGQDELEDVHTDKLSGEEKKIFDTICELALEKTKLKKQVLNQDEMKCHLQGNNSKDISLGLITVDRTAGLYGFRNIYTFLHLTYQEYLAAHHISTLSDEDQLKLIKQYGDADHMQVVWKFYFGLVQFEGHEYKIKALVNGGKIGLSDIQCAYESRQEIVCKVLVEENNAQIVLEDRYLTTTDFTALGYLLANSPVPVSLSLIKCQLYDEAVDAILAKTGGNPHLLHTLHCYTSLNLNLQSIGRLLEQQQRLKTLVIKQNMEQQDYKNHNFLDEFMAKYNFSKVHLGQSPNGSLDDHGFSHIIERSFVDLIELNLTNVQIGPNTLTNVLQSCRNLKSLTLHHSINDDCMIPLLTGLSQHEMLKTVSCSTCKTANIFYYTHISHNPKHSLRYSNIGTTNFDSIISHSYFQTKFNSFLHVEGVRRNHFHQTLLMLIEHTDNIVNLETFLPSTLKVFALHQRSAHHSTSIKTFIECISDFSALEKLVLTGFNFPLDATHLANMLRKCTMLQELDLSYGHTEQEDLRKFIKILGGLSKLEKLSWNNTYMRNDNVSELVSCLRCYWPNLRELHLRECGIKEKGAKAIIDSIDYCPELTVDLKGNDISLQMSEPLKTWTHISHTEVLEASSQSHTKSHLLSYCTLV